MKSFSFVLAALAAAASPAAGTLARADTIAADIQRDMPGLIAIYRDLHANPELSYKEVRSAAIMAAAARKAGFTVTEKVGGTGIVALMQNGPGPTVLIRADMDALPVVEQTGLAYASTRRDTSNAGVESGVMHACGHDTHMTVWIESARLLAARKSEWSGTLVMIGQPAEELGTGARAMLADGLFTRFPKPDYALAMHDSPYIPSGVFGVAPGYAMANADSVDIEVKGVGGHGAAPHLGNDPIVIAAAIVMRLQTLVSREQDPLDPAVVTVGSFHAGTKHNIISDSAKLQLTVRSYGDESRAHLLEGVRRIARAEALAAGLPEDLMPVVKFMQPHTPAVYNDPEFARQAMADLAPRFGADRIVTIKPLMAGDDFAEFRRTAPDKMKSLYFMVGGRPAEVFAAAEKEGTELPSLHSPFWAPEPDKVIATGAEALTATALRLMPKPG